MTGPQRWILAGCIVIALGAGATLFVAERMGAFESAGRSEHPDRQRLLREAFADDLRGRIGRGARVERSTVLVFDGECDPSEIAVLEEPQVIRAMRNAGFTSVECGSQIVPIR